jgi:hypothetical protein
MALRGSERFYTLKVDLDVPHTPFTLELARMSAGLVLEALGFDIAGIHFRTSINGRIHMYVFATHTAEFTPVQLAYVQALLGDDQSRVRINIARAGSGLPSWNLLGRTRVRWRRHGARRAVR